MQLSVLVVSYGNPALTCECLRSIADDISSLEAEVIVVDNASPDSTADQIALEHPDVKLIRSTTNLGFAKANNLAAESARGEFLLLINPDVVVHRGAIPQLLDFGMRHPEGGLYGGRTVDPQGRLDPRSCWGEPSLWSTFCFATGLSTLFRGSRVFDPETLGSWARDSEREVGVVTGCLALIRRDLWERIGGFDPTFFLYGEDTDLSMRVRRLGFRPCITPSATVTHICGASPQGNPDKRVRLLRARAAVFRRHWDYPSWQLGRFLLLAGTLWRSVGERVLSRHGPWRHAWHMRRSWKDGVQPR
jgi:N-acetylglucosaminyl-diphospho-decaprenol L-rhamnosyltransferase